MARLLQQIRNRLYAIWNAWSALQEREDEIWSETIGESSAENSTSDESSGCDTPREEIPELTDLVAQRNRERGKRSE